MEAPPHPSVEGVGGGSLLQGRSQPGTESEEPTLFFRQGQAWLAEPAKPEPFPPAGLPWPQPLSYTFQRLFMRYFLSKIWDLRRRLQRLAFSARLLSQGWARH